MRYEIGIPFLPSYLFGLVIKNIFTYAYLYMVVIGERWQGLIRYIRYISIQLER